MTGRFHNRYFWLHEIFGSFEGVMGVEGEERETDTDTEPHRDTLHHITQNTFTLHFLRCLPYLILQFHYITRRFEI